MQWNLTSPSSALPTPQPKTRKVKSKPTGLEVITASNTRKQTTESLSHQFKGSRRMKIDKGWDLGAIS